MGRIRTIKPEFFKHEGLYDAEIASGLPLRLAYAGLFTCCDREGRFKWRSRTLKTDILPFDHHIDFSKVLDALEKYGFIIKYQYSVDQEVYGCIPSWEAHQCVNNRESVSKLPPPPDVDACSTRVLCVDQTNSTPLFLAPGEGKGKEGERKEICISEETSDVSISKGDNKANVPIKADLADDTVKTIFKHWQCVMKHPKAKLDKKRKKNISAALQLGYSIEDLKQAIDGCAKTPFNMGSNDQKKRYDGIDVIFRDADHIERFMQNSHSDHDGFSDSMTQMDKLAEGAI